MRRMWKILILTGCLLFAVFAKAQNDSLPEPKPARLQLQGYLKDLQSLSFTSQKGSLFTGSFLHNRLNVKYLFSPTLSARLELRTRMFWGEQVRLNPDFAGQADYENGWLDMSWTPVRKPAFVWHSIADRLSLNWQYRQWDIVVGRQRVNWGITTAWNPNDLFNAFNFLDFDYEERPGSDALRVRYSRSGMSGFDLALSHGRSAHTTIAALIYRFNRWGYDLQVLGAFYKDDLVIGAGWAGNIGEAGFKGEASWFQPRQHIWDTTGTLSFTIDGAYSFENGWYIGGAFLYSSASRNDAAALDQLATQQLSAKMLMPFRYSTLAQVVKQFNPLFSTNLSVIYCPGPDALIIFPVCAYSLSDNWDLNLVAQSIFIPENNKFKNRGNALILRIKWGF